MDGGRRWSKNEWLAQSEWWMMWLRRRLIFIRLMKRLGKLIPKRRLYTAYQSEWLVMFYREDDADVERRLDRDELVEIFCSYWPRKSGKTIISGKSGIWGKRCVIHFVQGMLMCFRPRVVFRPAMDMDCRLRDFMPNTSTETWVWIPLMVMVQMPWYIWRSVVSLQCITCM